MEVLLKQPRKKNPIHLNLTSTSEFPYTYYKFLCIEGSDTLEPEKREFLEKQGILQVPNPTVVNAALQQYFIHVHPYLPLLKDDAFWNTNDDETYENSDFSQNRLSLFLFNAIMSASCAVGCNGVSIPIW